MPKLGYKGLAREPFERHIQGLMDRAKEMAPRDAASLFRSAGTSMAELEQLHREAQWARATTATYETLPGGLRRMRPFALVEDCPGCGAMRAHHLGGIGRDKVEYLPGRMWAWKAGRVIARSCPECGGEWTEALDV